MQIRFVKRANSVLSQNILITGCAGFIGSSLVEKLLLQNITILGIDNFDPFYNRGIKEQNIGGFLQNSNFKLFECDLINQGEINEIFKDNRIDIVIHLAAKAGVRPSIADPVEYYKTNVFGTINLLEAMKTSGCKKMIYASSSSVYGNNGTVPFFEQDRVDNPISPYAATKKAGELLCHTYHHLYDFDIFCLRFFTVYGPRQRPDLAIHKFARLILAEKPIPFFGDGSTERDYTYIDDIVEGVLGAINNLEGFDIFNLGESKTISLMKMVNTLENILGRKAILNKLPMQPGDVTRTFADISKAKNKLGYNPRFSFESGMKNFVEWFINYNENINNKL